MIDPAKMRLSSIFPRAGHEPFLLGQSPGLVRVGRASPPVLVDCLRSGRLPPQLAGIRGSHRLIGGGAAARQVVAADPSGSGRAAAAGRRPGPAPSALSAAEEPP